MTLADAAAEYLSNGWAIIALSGKAPNGKLHPQGLHNAMEGVPETPEDYSLIDTHFLDPETTGIGLVLPEHVVVVDIDGEDGAAAWKEMVGDLFVPENAVAKTGKGLHLWYTTVLPINKVSFGPHLDLKGLGGYVAVPPSQHPSGATYEWIVPLGKFGDPMYGIPDAVTARIAERAALEAEVKSERPAVVRDLDLAVLPKVYRLAPPTIGSGILEKVAESKPGNRNAALYWAACCAYEDGVALKAALPALVEAAHEAGLDAREARQTIRSAYRGMSRG